MKPLEALRAQERRACEAYQAFFARTIELVCAGHPVTSRRLARQARLEAEAGQLVTLTLALEAHPEREHEAQRAFYATRLADDDRAGVADLVDDSAVEPAQP